MLPNFLGIGARRAGTTWLDSQLRRHPDVFLPKYRKEVMFFDTYYDKGIEWYEKFFPGVDGGRLYKAVGEITALYLFDERVPARIAEHIPGCRFLVILRNPVDRAFSHYTYSVRNYNEHRDFRTYVSDTEDVLRIGLYAGQIARYFDYFPKNRFLILKFEDVMKEPLDALDKVADFLNIRKIFSEDRARERVNESYQPRFARSFALARSLGSYVRKREFDWIVEWAKSAGVRKIFGRKGNRVGLDQSFRNQLVEYYEEDIRRAEAITGLDLQSWFEPRNEMHHA